MWSYALTASMSSRAETAALWRAVVLYAREVSGGARYEHYGERFAREHPGEGPLSLRAYLRAREEHERLHPNTSCCC